MIGWTQNDKSSSMHKHWTKTSFAIFLPLLSHTSAFKVISYGWYITKIFSVCSINFSITYVCTYYCCKCKCWWLWYNSCKPNRQDQLCQEKQILYDVLVPKKYNSYILNDLPICEPEINIMKRASFYQINMFLVMLAQKYLPVFGLPLISIWLLCCKKPFCILITQLQIWFIFLVTHYQCKCKWIHGILE